MTNEYYYETKDVVDVISHFSSFDGNEGSSDLCSPVPDEKVRKWQSSYFELLSWKNTWCIPYEMDIIAGIDHSPYVRIVIPNDKYNIDWLVRYMEDLGYGDIKVYERVAGFIEPPLDESVDTWLLDY